MELCGSPWCFLANISGILGVGWGKRFLHRNVRTKSCNKINTGSRVSDVNTELEWECFLKSNSPVIEFQTKQCGHDEEREKPI